MADSPELSHVPALFRGERGRALTKRIKRALLDPSTGVLIAVNLATIGIAVWDHWDVATVIWIYWCQSVIIGLFAFLRFVTLNHFRTGTIFLNGKPAEVTTKSLLRIGLVFLLHYGIFLLAYLAILFEDFPVGTTAYGAIMNGALLFFLSHAVSFFLHHWFSARRQQNLGRAMVMPYARIIPMHLVTLFSFLFLSGFGLVLFMLLKTAADTATHVAEHM